MIELTIDMLKKKISAHEERIKALSRLIEEKECEQLTLSGEISSFKQSIEILESRIKSSK